MVCERLGFVGHLIQEGMTELQAGRGRMDASFRCLSLSLPIHHVISTSEAKSRTAQRQVPHAITEAPFFSVRLLRGNYGHIYSM